MLLERGAPAHSKGSLPDPIQTVAESGDRRLLQVLLDMTIFAAPPYEVSTYIFLSMYILVIAFLLKIRYCIFHAMAIPLKSSYYS